jgi:transcriptional regulator with XRE-family HTH domain
MTKEQAQRIGRMIATARRNRGWSLRRLSVETGYTYSWLSRLERGEYTLPTPEGLTRVVEVLGIDPERLERIAKGLVSGGLPGFRTYFRAKYELSQEEIDEVERTLEDINRKRWLEDQDKIETDN